MFFQDIPPRLLSAELVGTHIQLHHHQQILANTTGTKSNHGHHIHSQVSLFNFSLLYSSDLTANVFSYRSLYRRSLKLSLDWSIRRDIWRPQALNIRELFEANRDVKEPRQLRVWKTRSFAPVLMDGRMDGWMEDWRYGSWKIILQEAEETLERWKHPDPYRAPTAPGGNYQILRLPQMCNF